ncbi:hypothetical protein CHS0354_034995 [Potamilus streckersoni]|uniref:Uncharacterized protein n=1 Tax=Potamilus streckersoni TaxID=2493646 RepID=A0AAE0SE05_9BIVA|nr:hypothetical protein CHS0354_034995 [Potamilus streckersoni]
MRIAAQSVDQTHSSGWQSVSKTPLTASPVVGPEDAYFSVRTTGKDRNHVAKNEFRSDGKIHIESTLRVRPLSLNKDTTLVDATVNDSRAANVDYL